MKLISMTDFVLEQTELLYKDNPIKLTHKIINYAQFLKQPLTVDMFIGDKALFKGVIVNEDNYLQCDHAWVISIDELNDGRIEHLIDFDLELTDNAIKQLEL